EILVDPTIRIAADGASARVIADGQGSGEMNMGATEQQVEPFDDAHLLNLDLAGSGPRLSANGATRTWIAARARIASGLASRYLSYGEGSTYGDLTFSVPVDLETRLPDPVDPPVPPVPPTPPTPPAPPTPPFFPGPPGIPTPTPPGKVTKPTTAKLTGKLRGSKKAKRRVKITVSKRLGSKRTTYRVKLTKGRRTVATGTLRNRTLKLTVRKTVKKGKKAKYARLRGSYKLKAQPAKKSKKGQKAKRTKAPKLETTTLTIR
ncbi:MAG: hypothetical protein ITG02_12225, partial [Patulibacter sp.]|nr:hypothetical protein [Patulibacter sp.]